MVEGGDYLFQLIRFGLILGVEDYEEITLRIAQRKVAGFGFGLRMGGRDADDLEHAFEVELARSVDGLVVALFQHDLDVELGQRIVEVAQRLGKDRQHLGLAEHRHQHGIDRQVFVAQQRCLGRDGPR